MTDWKTVHDSRTPTPEALDATSSSSTVYERRNIRREAVTVGIGNTDATVTEWVYEQREYTRDEQHRAGYRHAGLGGIVL